mgnify:CR=1 FL=1
MKKKNLGFTLVELMVVVAAIAIVLCFVFGGADLTPTYRTRHHHH